MAWTMGSPGRSRTPWWKERFEDALPHLRFDARAAVVQSDPDVLRPGLREDPDAAVPQAWPPARSTSRFISTCRTRSSSPWTRGVGSGSRSIRTPRRSASPSPTSPPRPKRAAPAPARSSSAPAGARELEEIPGAGARDGRDLVAHQPERLRAAAGQRTRPRHPALENRKLERSRIERVPDLVREAGGSWFRRPPASGDLGAPRKLALLRLQSHLAESLLRVTADPAYCTLHRRRQTRLRALPPRPSPRSRFR
jgi:hypothetical protein